MQFYVVPGQPLSSGVVSGMVVSARLLLLGLVTKGLYDAHTKCLLKYSQKFH